MYYFFISNQLLFRLDNHVERCRTPGVAEKWRPRLFRARGSRRDLSSGDEMQWRQAPGWSDGKKRESLPTQVLVPCLLQRRVLRRGTVVKEGTIGGHLRIQRSAKYFSFSFSFDKARILVIYFCYSSWPGLDDKEVKEHDAEGRLITAEFESFFVCGVYVPNAGKKLITLPKVRMNLLAWLMPNIFLV